MTPVGNTIIPPNPMAGINAYSGMLGIQQQKQALQTGQYQQESAAAQATVAQQGAKELQAGSRLLADPVGNGLIDEDGNPTKNAYSIIKSVMPTTGDERYQSLIKTAQGHVEFRSAVQNLSQNEQGYVSSRLAGIAADPNAHISDISRGIDDLNAQFKGTAEEDSVKRMTKVMQDAIDDAGDKHGMDGVRKVVNGFSRGAIGNAGITGSGGVIAPSGPVIQAPNGAGVQATNTNPYYPGGVGPVGSPVAQGVAPSANVVTDSFGRQFILNPATNQVTPVGTGKPPGVLARSGPSFSQPVADQANALVELREARAATSQGGVTRNVNQHLLDLSQDTRTGPGTHLVQNLAAAIGLPSGSKYQEISAYLDRQAALQAQVMGVPNTNAGLAAAERATGTTEYTPQALREKVKFFDALNSGAMAYRQGLDKAVGTGATPDLSKYQAFRSAWTQNFDPDVYRAEDALRRGDKSELASLKQRLGQKGMSDLATKSANLRQLENGVIPGG